MNDIKSVLLDNSFVSRLTKKDDDFHQNVVNYFKYFMETKMIKSLTQNKNFKCKFFDLTIPLKDLLGELF